MTTAVTTSETQAAINAILSVLGEPENDWHHQAFDEFKEGDVEAVRLTFLSNLTDYFCKCLAFLVAAKQPTPRLSNILSASANAATDYIQQRTLKKLGEELVDTYKSGNPADEGIQVILKVLSSESEDDLHIEVLKAFSRQDYDAVRKLAASRSDDEFCKSVIFLTRAQPSAAAALPIIFAEAAGSASKFVKAQKLKVLERAIADALG